MTFSVESITTFLFWISVCHVGVPDYEDFARAHRPCFIVGIVANREHCPDLLDELQRHFQSLD